MKVNIKKILPLLTLLASWPVLSQVDKDQNEKLKAISIMAISSADSMVVIKMDDELQTLEGGDTVLDLPLKLETVMDKKLVLRDESTGELVYLIVTKLGQPVQVQRLSRETPDEAISIGVKTISVNPE